MRNYITKKNKSYIDINEILVPNNVQVQSLTEAIRSDIKKNVEYFTEMPVRKLEVNVRDQKTSGPLVLKVGISWLTIITKTDKTLQTQQVINFLKVFKWGESLVS